MIDKNFACCANCKKYRQDKQYPTTGWCKEKRGVRIEDDYPCVKYDYKYGYDGHIQKD
jgi:hypothetical protein